jgi:uncharacterized protein DUF6335
MSPATAPASWPEKSMATRKSLFRRRRGMVGIGRGESQSMTGRFIEGLTTGESALPPGEPEIPGTESMLMRMGDPDVSALQNEYAGDESPGATSPTPDQNLIDDVGRAYGVMDAENGALRTSSELLDRRDGAHPGLPKASARRSL